MITGRPPTTRRETYLRNLLSVVSKFLSFGILEIGRPRYAKLRGDIISEMRLCMTRRPRWSSALRS